MKIEIQARRFSLTDPLRGHVVRSIEHALQRHRAWIERVEVRLGDVNGPRGGRDKFCSVVVRLTILSPLVIKDLGSELYAVISSAADRAGRSVSRRMAQRIRTKRRLGMAIEPQARFAHA